MTQFSPIAATLATLAVLGFCMTSGGFLALAWRSGWAMGRFVTTAESASASVRELVTMFREFVVAQKKHNEEFELAIEIQAERVNRVAERLAAGAG